MKGNQVIHKSRAKDLFLYVFISGAFIACIVAAIELGVDRNTFMNVIGFTFSLLFFGFFIEASRSRWKTSTFWWLTSLLLVMHSVGFWGIVHKAGEFKPAWFPVLIVEYAVFLGCRNLIPAKF